MRLNKFLSKAGIASRRAADNLVAQGRVKVNGQVVTALGTVIDENNDKVLFDNKPIGLPDEFVYILLNKPTGYLVTCKDPGKRNIVIELVGEYGRVVRPVGRLDMDSSGLLLLTNDGELAFRLSHPRFKIDKTYEVKCEGFLTDESIEALTNGVELDDGMTWPANLEIISRTKNFSKFLITIHEGRKRQIRRMGLAVGNKVLTLSRVKYGDIAIGNLKKGKYRLLSEKEINSLKQAVGYEQA